jgi:transposase
MGRKRLATYLRNRGVQGADGIAGKALTAARAQSVTLPAQEVAARVVAELAEEVLSLKDRIDALDEELGQRFFARPEAPILVSLPGMGLILGAEFLVAVGDICAPSLAPTGSPPTRRGSSRPPTTLWQEGR